MFLFFDESYERISSTEVLHVYAGFAIRESKYRHLVASTHQLKQKFLRSSDGMDRSARDRAWRTHFLVRGEPDHAEIKAKDLLSMTTLTAKRDRGFAAGYELAFEAVSSAENIGATTFGVISYPQSIQSIQHDADRLPIHLVRIMECVNLWMEEMNEIEPACFVLDTLNSRTNPILSRHFTEYLMKSVAGKNLRKIVPSPFWVDSVTTTGSQIADIVAHVLMNSARQSPMRKEGLEPIWAKIKDMQFKSYDGVKHSITKMRKPAHKK